MFPSAFDAASSRFANMEKWVSIHNVNGKIFQVETCDGKIEFYSMVGLAGWSTNDVQNVVEKLHKDNAADKVGKGREYSLHYH